ncbi:MAG: DUF362 domain-containing protein [Gemmatimonadetes bacterium]|nr:DUF362 domain-containing protein [Gemmatimonadota bacterium]MDE0964289.1 DUF362 domain-containing protein [Candidatus Latescibacterota bacterium]MBT6618629.1 DUF362 domain-containing protein [Gemmatimonadota bacterium]MBT6903629.1 DUF362 domain-containing protein [Gemmatimonadota bacterium]MBT7417482.1 DUF362 domain-containing protein [Gemmatimonadota bacterium]
MSDYKVRAAHCDYRAEEDQIYEALKRATDPLTETWDRLAKAKRIGIKFNHDQLIKQWIRYEGQLQQLVSEKLARAFLRLMRERTDAELVSPDVSFYKMYDGTDPEETGTLIPIFREFGVEFIDGTLPPYKTYPVPGGGQMFSQYLLPQRAMEVDEFISVGKMKNHGFMGITLSLKNLFGLMPGEPEGNTRTYYHHLVRMPYMLADMGRLFNPALCIVDGLVGQAGMEWGNGDDKGPGRVANTLVAGNHTIATDACTAHLMGHDPQSDWLTPPFHRDRNSLLVAAEAGFGTVDLNEIDFESEVTRPLNEFFSHITDSQELVLSWRRTTCEQALYYRDNRQKLLDEYAGEYILLQEGEVRWHDKVSDLQESRRVLAGDKPEQAMWLKYVDPEEAEGEHFEVYEKALAKIEAADTQAA